MNIKLIISCITLLFSLSLTGQNEIWEKTPNQKELRNNIESSKVYPTSYTLFNINEINMQAFLESAPKRANVNNKESLPILSIPNPNGDMIRFHIEEASVMDKELQKKFPNIKSFAGYGVDQKDSYLRFDYSHKGYRFQILSSEYGTIKIEPSKSNKEVYLCYFKKDIYLSDDQDKFVCAFDEKVHVPENYEPSNTSKFLQGDNDLRDYRLAVACTGEYADYHGGTVADAAAAINSTITRVVGIYERDFSITMTLIGNNDDVIYLDAATDPFTNGNANLMVTENRDNMNAVIGSANFDVGHLFGTAGAGLAYLNGPCGSNKARATSAIGNPVGDVFDVDYVSHEFGHQFGARHTQYNDCNKNPNTAMEPGSASTIMGYAGICSPNVQNNSDDYFHAISIEEIEDFTTTGNGNNCPTITDLGNSFPTASAGNDYTIPKSTPFVLTATGSDPDGDALTYTWEQMDNEGSETQPPDPTNDQGPMFRTFKPTTDNQRFFPAIPVVVSGNASDWEVLPSVGRDLNFRVTVRDNAAGNGLTEEDDCLVTVDGSSGPFEVTAPNTAVQWNTGETKTVSWDVADTDIAPVSCTNVDIMLSLDEGYTYTTTLASNVTNDGSHSIVVPNVTSSFARVRIMCSNNIFYDISDVNFGINVPAFPDYCDVIYSNNSCNSNDYIDDVDFNTINNIASGCATDGVNYSDFSNQSTVVDEGTTYTLSVKPTPDYSEYFAAYIDWNLDGDFLDADEFHDIGQVPAGTTETIDITIPTGQAPGERIFRVICRFGNNALTAADGCGGTGFNYGEVEDYRVILAEPCLANITVNQDYNNGDTEIVSANNNITATNIINGGADIQYVAGTDIDLNTGFEVKVNAVFEAYIGPCQ